MCATPRIDQAQLAVEKCRVRRQFGEGPERAGELDALFRAALRVEPHINAMFDHLEAKAIPLGAVQPIVALGRADGCRGG
jgi:hypothetical protein